MREQLAQLDKTVLDQVRGDKLCRRLTTVPGVGPIVALTFRAIVAPARRFAVVMHRMRVAGTEFRGRKEADTAAA